jgi:PIN domain nuclease of toxin-antitoxin system
MVDSNVLIWALVEPERLTDRVRAILSASENQVLISEASVWELANKIHAGRLTSVGDSIRTLLAEIAALNMTLLPIGLQHILRTETLPHHHRDPFDRIIIAQAMERQVPLIASDAKIKLYDLEVIW